MTKHFRSFTKDAMTGLALSIQTSTRQRALQKLDRKKQTATLLARAHEDRVRTEQARQKDAARERAARWTFTRELRAAQQNFRKACLSAQQKVRGDLFEMAAERRAASAAFRQLMRKNGPRPDLRPATLTEALLGQTGGRPGTRGYRGE